MLAPQPTPLLLCVLVLASAASSALAQEPPRPQSPCVHQHGSPATAASAPPVGRHAVGVELAGTTLGEAWNLNEGREWVAGGSAAAWWAVHPRVTLRLELQGLRVYQQPERDASVLGILPSLRVRFADRGPWAGFVELGPGLAWSTAAVPTRGTRFNYLALIGAGVARHLGRRTQAVVGFRWLHLSNAGREGLDHNPDIQALGPYAGIGYSF
jgi:hypothetical protein